MSGSRPYDVFLVPRTSCMMKLPVELTTIILDEACTPGADVPILLYCEVYNLRCMRLRHTSPIWNALIRQNPMFWTKLHINCWTQPAQVDFHLQFLGNLSMDVTVELSAYTAQYLDGPLSEHSASIGSSVRVYWDVEYSSSESYYSTSYSGSVSPSDRSSRQVTLFDGSAGDSSVADEFDYPFRADLARRSMTAALPSVDRWMRVCIWTYTDVFLDVVLDVLGGVPGPSLKHLVFGCPFDDDEPAAVNSCLPILTNPRPMFGAHLPAFETAHLVGVPVSFIASHLPGLRCLCIRDLSLPLRPLVPDFVRSLTGMVCLEEMVVGGGDPVFPRGTVLSPRFFMPNLRILTVIGAASSEEFFRVLLAMDAPLLRQFRFYDLSATDWATVILLMSLYSLEDVSVYGYHGTSDQVHMLLLALFEVVTVRFLRTGDGYVQRLALDPALCPRLRHLIVGHVDLQLLITFVAARQHFEFMRIWSIEIRHEFVLPLSLQVYDSLCVLRLYVPELVTVPDVS
ncbi:hypothetical protein C8R47DRAFT_1162260 [Mycena vitilis]|nr:hypothetical protein C8R47DRAFT_1162260 [Mycena vitilis]